MNFILFFVIVSISDNDTTPPRPWTPDGDGYGASVTCAVAPENYSAIEGYTILPVCRDRGIHLGIFGLAMLSINPWPPSCLAAGPGLKFRICSWKFISIGVNISGGLKLNISECWARPAYLIGSDVYFATRSWLDLVFGGYGGSLYSYETAIAKPSFGLKGGFFIKAWPETEGALINPR